MNIDIRFAGPGDEGLFADVAEDVFDHDIIPDRLTQFLNDPSHFIAVALDGETIVGICSANEYLHPDKPVQCWIAEMGVAPSHQRQGIGKALLQAMLQFLESRGYEEVWLGTEVDNTAANALYRSVEHESENFVLYTFEFDDESGD